MYIGILSINKCMQGRAKEREEGKGKSKGLNFKLFCQYGHIGQDQFKIIKNWHSPFKCTLENGIRVTLREKQHFTCELTNNSLKYRLTKRNCVL